MIPLSGLSLWEKSSPAFINLRNRLEPKGPDTAYGLQAEKTGRDFLSALEG